ncbi:23S rRNA (adenine(1618)-N(6))-methyltransferase RlmF [Mucilaginibacter gynuensis]|uniref:Ribosomal RNA large subunit methyltransferase F n=1 Tax=Mucilaginibacter gynuensis TaxID=1302236 RepID=A0ABP8GHM7_9SPHI
MSKSATPPPPQKENLHPRNLHRGQYNFAKLIKALPELREFVKPNPDGIESIDFGDAEAVVMLNKALLKAHYAIDFWSLPAGYLCPPIPGRADYLHYMADLLADSNEGLIPKGSKVKVLDIGSGANCIYPLIGNSAYGWQFTGSDVDQLAVNSAKNIVSQNPRIKPLIELRVQANKNNIFPGIILPGETFDLTICNPPFHASLKEAQAGTIKKWENLNREQKTALNFGGKKNELWYTGGEAGFITKMIEQSAQVAKRCFWFTTLVSKKDNLPHIYKTLEWQKVAEVKTINMAQGQKVSRVVAWTFLSPEEQAAWRKDHWQQK